MLHFQFTRIVITSTVSKKMVVNPTLDESPGWDFFILLELSNKFLYALLINYATRCIISQKLVEKNGEIKDERN